MKTNHRKRVSLTDATRREEILDKAMKFFSLKGYHGTTLDEVANEIGITKALIYYYFSSKENIIREILKISINRVKKIEQLGNSSLPTIEKLRQFILYHVEFSTETFELARITFEQVNLLPKKTRDSIKSKFKVVDKTLQNIIQDGIDEGIIQSKDVKVASYAILGMCNWIYHWYHPGGRLTPHEIANACIHLLENGYLKNPPLSSAEKPEVSLKIKQSRKRTSVGKNEVINPHLY